jgi:hypothetical protein
MIMQGATKGRVARVVGSSAGWVNVRMADEDGNEPSEADASLVKAKRAVDLNLLLGHGLKTREDAAAFGSTPPEVAEKRPYKRHKTLLSQVQAAEANADSAASGNDEDAAAETARKSKRASVSVSSLAPLRPWALMPPTWRARWCARGTASSRCSCPTATR